MQKVISTISQEFLLQKHISSLFKLPHLPTNDNWVFKTNLIECNELSYPEQPPRENPKEPKEPKEQQRTRVSRQHPSRKGSLSLSLSLVSCFNLLSGCVAV